MKVVSIVGKSKSGKTTLIERLVPILIRKGLKVAVVKHAKMGFEIDREGKDSYRIFRSGADVVIVSEEKLAFIKRVESDDINQCLELLKGYDLILTEGFSKLRFPKIALDNGNYENVIAVVNELNDEVVERIADLIIKGVMNDRERS